MSKVIKQVLDIFKDSYVHIVAIIEEQLQSTLKTFILAFCIGVFVMYIFTYYPVYSELDKLGREVHNCHVERDSLFNKLQKEYQRGRLDSEAEILRVKELINNLKKDAE